MKDDFWERSDVVDQFASRDPDHRLVKLVDEYADPGRIRAFDLGCAAGRNTVFLAERGFEVHGMDASEAMVARTRERLAPLLGAAQADGRVRVGRMDDLSIYADGHFHLIVALGVYHNARGRGEWDRALAETARVMAPGGRLLLNHFTPEVDLTGEGVRPVEGEADVFEGFPGGRAVLLSAAALDRAVGGHGFVAEVPSETVTAKTERGRRVSVNALYLKE